MQPPIFYKDIKMKLKLNKKQMKSLSANDKSMPLAMTPQVAGGTGWWPTDCLRTICQIVITEDRIDHN